MALYMPESKITWHTILQEDKSTSRRTFCLRNQNQRLNRCDFSINCVSKL